MMKNRFILSNFFYFVGVLSLLVCFGCGRTEDEQEAISPTNNPFLEEPAEQLPELTAEDREKLEEAKQWLHLALKDWGNLKDEDWEKLKDGDWIRLTDAEVKELMNLEVPPNWAFADVDEALRKKHREAQLFQQFGDIPQLRYIVEFDRMRRSGIVTLELAMQMVAKSAAMYFLFPNANNQQSFETIRNLLQTIIEQGERGLEEEELRRLDQLRIEDPEAWMKGMRAFLVKKHDDIPEVDTIVNFLRKVELNLPRTDEECHTYLEAYNTLYIDSGDFGSRSLYEYYVMFEAVDQVSPIVKDEPLQILEKFRAARAAGISLYDIKEDDD